MGLDINNISKILTDKKATNPCHRCGGNDFTIADGYSMIGLQDSTKGIMLGGKSIPAINVICTHCGAITSHALGVLGLLDNEKGNQDGK